MQWRGWKAKQEILSSQEHDFSIFVLNQFLDWLEHDIGRTIASLPDRHVAGPQESESRISVKPLDFSQQEPRNEHKLPL
jgi:hypothetical protein